MTFDELPLIFQDCVADHETRYKRTEPWVLDGYACATDGRIVVRMTIEDPDSGNGPDVSDLRWGHEHYETEPVELPALPLFDRPDGETCEHCGEVMFDGDDGVRVGKALLKKRFIRLLRWYDCTAYLAKDAGPKAAKPVLRFTHLSGTEGLVMGMAYTPK